MLVQWRCWHFQTTSTASVIYELNLLFFFIFISGQSGLSGQRRNKPEPGRAQQRDVWGGPAANLHPDAPRLLPPFPQLLCLQRPPGQQEAHLPRHLDLLHPPSSPSDTNETTAKTSNTTMVPEVGFGKFLPLFWLKWLNDIRDSWLIFLFIFFKQFISSSPLEPGRPLLVGYWSV